MDRQTLHDHVELSTLSLNTSGTMKRHQESSLKPVQVFISEQHPTISTWINPKATSYVSSLDTEVCKTASSSHGTSTTSLVAETPFSILSQAAWQCSKPLPTTSGLGKHFIRPLSKADPSQLSMRAQRTRSLMLSHSSPERRQLTFHLQ